MMLLWFLLAEGIRDSEIIPEINTEIHLEKKKKREYGRNRYHNIYKKNKEGLKKY